MFDKITKGTVDATISTKDYTVKKWKRFIRKRAIKRVEKNLKYLQKDASEYTKEEMRELIEKEEKSVISTITATVGIGAVLTMLGIPKI
jgi:hypothetical protein|tara:strand:- start:1017 stop:1283 length:267 start_codon:yes stop_codon:yes gene_type:complete